MVRDRESWLKSQAEFYENKLNKGEEMFYAGPYAETIKLKWLSFVGQFVFDGAAVLEVGCGDGWQSRWLANNGAARVVAIDLTPGFVEKARLLSSPGLSERISYICCAAESPQ